MSVSEQHCEQWLVHAIQLRAQLLRVRDTQSGVDRHYARTDIDQIGVREYARFARSV
jgi:hypothetical protein